VLGSGLILLASFLIMMGILEVEAALLVVGSVMGAAGSGTFFWGWKALQDRRQVAPIVAQVHRGEDQGPHERPHASGRHFIGRPERR
jgi:hypothetical protein